MPYGKRKVHRKSNRSYVRKGTRVARRSRTYRGFTKVPKNRAQWKNPLPTSSYYKLRYQDSTFNALTVAGYDSFLFRGNGMYDPDATGVGVQPYAYDNLCAPNAPFGAYLVYGSKIKIYPHQESATFKIMRMTVAPIRDTSPSYIEFEDLSQIPGHRTIVNKSEDQQRTCLSAYASTAKVCQCDINDVECQALYNAVPSRPWFWYFQIDTQDSSGYDNVPMTFDVQITYYCKLIRTQNVNES